MNFQKRINHNQSFSDFSKTQARNLKKLSVTIHFHPGAGWGGKMRDPGNEVAQDPRPGGLVVSASDFQTEGPWFEPGLCHRIVFLGKKLCTTLSLSTQVYKWEPVACSWG